MKNLFLIPLIDVTHALYGLAQAKRPQRDMLLFVTALVATWFLYVPVHELLHVAGCLLTGGSVSELQIAPMYGGALYARWFSFVVAGGDYAGRLTGFDYQKSDFIYLMTDFGPYVLTVVMGVPLLRYSGRRWRPIVFGCGVVVGLAPVYNLPGDYYEMASICVTRIITIASNSDAIAYAGLRADDVFRLTGDVITQPGEVGIEGLGGQAIAGVLILSGMIVSVLLAFLTYGLGHLVAVWIFGMKPAQWSHLPKTGPQTL